MRLTELDIQAVRKRMATPRCTARRGRLVESYFAKLNSPDGRRALWLKFTATRRPEAPGALAEAWAVAFARGEAPRACKQAWTLDERELERAFRGGPRLRLARCQLGDARTQGSLRGSGADIGWDVSFVPGALDAPLAPLPRALYREALPTSKLVSQHPDLRFDGAYSVSGTRVDVTGWRGMIGHNWGTRHTPDYAWLHCNQFREETNEAPTEGVLEAVSAPLWLGRRGGCAVLRLGGDSLVFGLLDWRQREEARSPSAWAFCAAHAGARLSVQVRTLQLETAGLRYVNPTQGGVDCLNSKLGRLSLLLERPGQPAVRLVSDAAALEHGWCGAHPVRMLL